MKRTIQVIVGLLIGIGLLWLLFRNTNWAEVFAAMRHAHPGWLALGMGILLISFFTRVQRWTYIVRTAGPVSYRKLFSATQIGFLANFTLPGRIGEAVRALVLARLTRLPFSQSFAMVALDRVTDLVGLLVVTIVTIMAYSPTGEVVIPKSVFNVEITFGAERVHQGEVAAILGLVVAVAGFVLLYVNQRLMLRVSDACCGVISKTFAARVHGFLQGFADGLHVFRSASDMAKSCAFSILTWMICVLFFVIAMHAFDIHGPWYTAFVMELLLAIAISVPGAPGFVGQFHVPMVIAIMMLIPETGIAKAKALAIIVHLMNVFPVLIIGAFCLFREHLGLVELTRTSTLAEDQPTDVPTPVPPSQS